MANQSRTYCSLIPTATNPALLSSPTINHSLKGWLMSSHVKFLSFRIPRGKKNLRFDVTSDDTLSSILSKMYVLYKGEYEDIHQERFPILRWTDEYAEKIVMDDGQTFLNKKELETACMRWLEDVWNAIEEDKAKLELVRPYTLSELKSIIKKGTKA